MNNEEKIFLYNYMHEYFKYDDGKLIVIKNIKHSKKIGDVLAGFFYQGTGGSPKIRACISVNGHRYRWPFSHFIWFFHFMEKPKYIHHINLNPIDNRLENIKNSSLTELQSMCREKRRGYKIRKNKNVTLSYRVIVEYMYKKINIGSFRDEKIAREIYIKSREILESGVTSPREIINKLIDVYPEEPFTKYREVIVR